MPNIERGIVALLLALFGGGFAVLGMKAAAPSGFARVNVYKDEPLLNPDQQAEATAKVIEIAHGLGFDVVADYSSRVLFKGSESGLSVLIETLERSGFQAERALDLDSFEFHGLTINSDTGPSPGQTLDDGAGTYFVTLDGYPLSEWLSALGEQVNVAQPVGAAAYIVVADSGVASTLRDKFSWVRGVFRLAPDLTGC